MTFDLSKELELNRHRVISLIDMDCFYAQVEAKRNNIPSHKPLAVQQWSAVIANNYASREFGVKRGDSLSDIRKKCPDIIMCHVDVVTAEGEVIAGKHTPQMKRTCKVTLERYRVENYKILDIFRRFTPLVERASIDEAYLDLTHLVNKEYEEQYISSVKKPMIEWKGTVIGGEFNVENEWDIKLMLGTHIINRVRDAVLDELGYTSSAGIAHNKKFAKMISSFNKPNGQTILPTHGLPHLLSHTPFRKLQGFGGKLGENIATQFAVETFADITNKIKYDALCNHFGVECALWIWKICHGIDQQSVKIVFNTKRFGSCKNLSKCWLHRELFVHFQPIIAELIVRIINDRKLWKRIPTNLCLSYRTTSVKSGKMVTINMPYFPSEAVLRPKDNCKQAFMKYCGTILNIVMKLLPKESKTVVYTNISVSVTAFVDIPKQNILSYFSTKLQKRAIVEEIKNEIKENGNNKSRKRMRTEMEDESTAFVDNKCLEMQSSDLKTMENAPPPLKKANVDRNESKENVDRIHNNMKCHECGHIICDVSNEKQKELIQIHLDEHLAEELASKLNHSSFANSMKRIKKSAKERKDCSKLGKVKQTAYKNDISRFFKSSK